MRAVTNNATLKVLLPKMCFIDKQRQIKPKILHENNSVPAGEKGAVNYD